MADDENIPYHVQKVIDGKVRCIFLVKTRTVEGFYIFAYCSVLLKNVEKFAKGMRSERFNLTKYADLILLGDGEPDEEAKAFMEEEFGFDHSQMTDLQTLQ